jgi:hypothetical protein
LIGCGPTAVTERTAVYLSDDEMFVIAECLREKNVALSSYLQFLGQTNDSCRSNIHRIELPQICRDPLPYVALLEHLRSKTTIDVCQYYCDGKRVYIADIVLSQSSLIILLLGNKDFYTHTSASATLEREQFFINEGYRVDMYYDHEVVDVESFDVLTY